jgi:hypothetical protein
MIHIRKPTEDDLLRFKECLAADPDHAGQDAELWSAEPGEFWTFCDAKGNRLWVRMERVLRISIQHDQRSSKIAMMKILYKAFHWLLGSARQSQFSELIFESRANRLIQFLQKLFGVEPVKENYHLRT